MPQADGQRGLGQRSEWHTPDADPAPLQLFEMHQWGEITACTPAAAEPVAGADALYKPLPSSSCTRHEKTASSQFGEQRGEGKKKRERKKNTPSKKDQNSLQNGVRLKIKCETKLSSSRQWRREDQWYMSLPCWILSVSFMNSVPMNAIKPAISEPEIFTHMDPGTAPQKQCWENHGNSCRVLRRNRDLLGRLNTGTTWIRNKNGGVNLHSFQPDFTPENPPIICLT